MRFKELFILLLFVSGSIDMTSQVGINTTNPQEELHVAGATANARVDGLNATNNAENLGAGLTTRVYVDADGDLVLGDSGSTIEILVDSENYLEDVENSTNIINQVGTSIGYNTAGTPANIPAATFTLTKNAILEINYSVSYSVYKTSNPNGRIDDRHARIVQTALFFRQNTIAGPAVVNDVDGNPINGGPWCIDVNPAGTVCLETGGMIGLNGQFYTNGNGSRGAYQNFRNTGTDYVKLGPGTYVAMFAGQLAVGNVGGTGAVKMYLGSGDDDLQIIAYYYE
ncbi:MAG: hypothetical protein KJO05_07745 [Bacteroidia bacterium]|nr:hypothetical protein [Bacteroidia bacterium]MBT8275098.1 hypothetical protein [Bacteroidia bacterium]NNF31949.1 hypothetical protein [Flavobacteriaceae bacterium]NNK52924.1 hypothetical protein [Flavobacteriaceae bacterium]NNM09347.1 hypothetical protein [Flavobacteriaceae bacterium]